MENKKSFLLIFTLVISIQVYLFAQLKEEQKRTVVAPEPTNNSVQIKLNKVVIKKQEVKPKPKIEKKRKIVKKEIVKKKLLKTKSQNIIKNDKEKKKVVKKIVKKATEKPVKKEKPKKTFQETIKQQQITQKVEKKHKEINKKVLNAVKNDYLSKLRSLIEKNKKYPRSAKRLKQMGKVYLSFTIAKNGDIKNIKITKNSRHHRLNKAALEILSNIKKFDAIPKELKKSTWDITVPVVYQIVRS